jgi:hypothetical protein
MERMAMRVGPIAIEVIEPLKRLKVTIEETEGLAGEFTFTARAAPIEEPRFIHRIGPRAFMDYTRMTQNGHYEGWIEADGVRDEMAAGTMGTRDRSWGVRPVGARDEQPVPGAPLPSFFWQWTPINLDGGSLFFHVNADPVGRAWNTRAAFAPDGCGLDAVAEGEGTLSATLQQGTRWPSGATLDLDVRGAPTRIALEPLARFQMKGIGYTHPEWGHGLHHGPLRVAREDFALAELDPAAMDNLHVQMLCRATGDASGMGVFEQLAIGPYAPLGLDGIADPA